MKHLVILLSCLAGLLWMVSGCAEEQETIDRDGQTVGYVEPEPSQRQYTDRELEEAFRPPVPKMY